jgi:hypothetical protein
MTHEFSCVHAISTTGLLQQILLMVMLMSTSTVTFASSLSLHVAAPQAPPPPLQPAPLGAPRSPVTYTPKGPRFSWETLPIFFHGSNASGPVNQVGLQVRTCTLNRPQISVRMSCVHSVAQWPLTRSQPFDHCSRVAVHGPLACTCTHNRPHISVRPDAMQLHAVVVWHNGRPLDHRRLFITVVVSRCMVRLHARSLIHHTSN